MKPATSVLALAGTAELVAAATDRFNARRTLYAQAVSRALELQRPLLVIGDPDAGLHTRITRAYGCGSVCLDQSGCPRCPTSIKGDLTKGPVPFIADNSAVVFVSCVLEYVSDPYAAWRECLRMAGSSQNIFLVTVDWWAATAVLYPGARWTITRDGTRIHAVPISTARKAAYAVALGGLLWSSLASKPSARTHARAARGS
jgi:hypothetical protein